MPLIDKQITVATGTPTGPIIRERKIDKGILIITLEIEKAN